MPTRFLIAACLVCWSGIGAGQVSGKFYLEKSVYALGEPIFVYFEAVNNGPAVEVLYSADPYSICSAFRTVISKEGQPEYHGYLSANPPRPLCGRGISCISSSVALQHGGRHLERILLNLQHKLDQPGLYFLEAKRSHQEMFRYKDMLEVHTTLSFRIDEHVARAAVFQPWLDQLRATDPLKRIEAARALASVAPRSLEDALLRFADDPDLEQFAPLAFHRLNTPRSMAAMAELVDKTDIGTFEHWQASAYLSHDPCADEF